MRLVRTIQAYQPSPHMRRSVDHLEPADDNPRSGRDRIYSSLRHRGTLALGSRPRQCTPPTDTLPQPHRAQHSTKLHVGLHVPTQLTTVPLSGTRGPNVPRSNRHTERSPEASVTSTETRNKATSTKRNEWDRRSAVYHSPSCHIPKGVTICVPRGMRKTESVSR